MKLEIHMNNLKIFVDRGEILVMSLSCLHMVFPTTEAQTAELLTWGRPTAIAS
jgi:hypothetical protein